MMVTARTKQHKVAVADEARGLSHALTDPEPVRTHLQGLVAAGFSVASVARAGGKSEGTLRWILDGKGQQIRGTVARRWLAVTPHDVFLAAADVELVPTFAAVRRLRALARMGWRLDDVEVLGLELVGRHVYAGMAVQQERIGAGRHRGIAAVFDKVHMQDGPSKFTRNRALRNEWAPPLAWDEHTIDDPAGMPDLGAPDVVGVDDVVVARALSTGAAAAQTFSELHTCVVVAWLRGYGDVSGANLLAVPQRQFARHVAAYKVAREPREAQSHAEHYLSAAYRPDPNHSIKYVHALVVHMARNGLGVDEIVAVARAAGRHLQVKVVQEHLAAYLETRNMNGARNV